MKKNLGVDPDWIRIQQRLDPNTDHDFAKCLGADPDSANLDPRHCFYYSILQCCGSGSTGSTCFRASWIRLRILLSLCKNSKKNLDSYLFVTPVDFLSLKNDVNVATKSNKQTKLC
jgi:hypothetical protein